MRRLLLALGLVALASGALEAQTLTPPPAKNSAYPCRNDGTNCGGGGAGTVTTTGAPANGQVALISGATSVTGDTGFTWSGTGATMALSIGSGAGQMTITPASGWLTYNWNGGAGTGDAYGYIAGTGPRIYDGTKGFFLDFNVQSLSANRTATWPNAATSIPVIPQTITVLGPTAARTYTLPDANVTLAPTASPTFTGTVTAPIINAAAQPGADTAPIIGIIKGTDAYAQATTNTTGAALNLAGGIGRRFYTVVTFGSLSGKTATLTANGTAVVLTEGVDWNAVTSNNQTATNLAAAITANGTLGPLMTATASSAVVYIQPKTGLYSLTIATNAGAPMTATSGTDGVTTFPGGLSAGGGGFTVNVIGTTVANALTVSNGLLAGTGATWIDTPGVALKSAGIYGWTATTSQQTVETALSRVSAGVVGVGTGAAGNAAGAIVFTRQTLAKTGAYTTTLPDSNTMFTNTGAGGSVTITLLNDPTVGAFYKFCATVAQDLVVAPNTGETLYDGATSYSSVKVNGLGNCFEVEAVTGGSGAAWAITSKNGTVTDTP